MNVLSKPCVNIFRPWRTWTWTIFRVFHSVVTNWRKFVFPIGFESVWKRKQKKTSPRGSRCANNPLSWVQIQLVASAVLRNLKFSCNWKRKTDSNHSTIWGLVASVRKWNNHSKVFVVSVKIDCSVAIFKGSGHHHYRESHTLWQLSYQRECFKPKRKHQGFSPLFSLMPLGGGLVQHKIVDRA